MIGRIDDLIIVGSHNVFPADIEETILGSNLVAECLVYSKKHLISFSIYVSLCMVVDIIVVILIAMNDGEGLVSIITIIALLIQLVIGIGWIPFPIYYIEKRFNKDRDKIINYLLNSDLECIVECGTNTFHNERAINYCENHENVYATIGYCIILSNSLLNGLL